jgi:hypothetical protein
MASEPIQVEVKRHNPADHYATGGTADTADTPRPLSDAPEMRLPLPSVIRIVTAVYGSDAIAQMMAKHYHLDEKA